jgi:hypothetical protein
MGILWGWGYNMKKPVRPTHGNDNNYQQVLDRTHDILNGGIDLGAFTGFGGVNVPGNLNNIHVQVTTPGVVNTDFTVTHNLNRVPTGARISKASGLCNIWAGTVAWSKTTVTLQADHINTVLILEIY